MIVPYTANDAYFYDNGSFYLGNSQLVVSIVATNTTVSATCSVGVVGVITVILAQANSLQYSGTYVCTTHISVFQAVSAALSITLTAIGVCRVYFMVKGFYATKATTQQQ